jgi:2-methylcitrate dehydratase PrpD
VLAASLASDGFTGPVSVLEGEFGFLRVFCGNAFDPAELTRGLGESYATRSIMLKRTAARRESIPQRPHDSRRRRTPA